MILSAAGEERNHELIWKVYLVLKGLERMGYYPTSLHFF